VNIESRWESLPNGSFLAKKQAIRLAGCVPENTYAPMSGGLKCHKCCAYVVAAENPEFGMKTNRGSAGRNCERGACFSEKVVSRAPNCR
jgi:hypothetical protein